MLNFLGKSKCYLRMGFLLLGFWGGNFALSQEKNTNKKSFSRQKKKTNKQEKASLDTSFFNRNDTLITMPKDSSKINKNDTASVQDDLEAPIVFSAKDSTTIGINSKKIHLFNEATVEYQDMNIKGEHLEMDQRKQVVTIYPTADSAGNVGFKDKTVFKQSTSTYLSDTARYNYVTQKSLTSNTYTKQGDMTVFGEVIKKVSADEVFIKKARFSTCNLDHPHFDFVSSKAKFRQNKYGATGPIFIEIEDVKIPIPFPFSFFPLMQGVKNGILTPALDQNSVWGYGLREGGYYFKVKDYFNAITRASFYTSGTFTINLRTEYKLRYRFSGDLNFDYQDIRTTLLGDLVKNNSRTFNVNYVHRVDGKATPNSSFNVNMNFGSSQYNRLQIYDAAQNFNNSVNSSLNYSHRFSTLPSNITIAANHTQNSVTRLYNVTLPSVSYTISNVQPLQMILNSAVEKWYEKLTFQYSANYTSNAAFFDTAVSFRQIKDTFRWGVSHTPSISLPLPALGPLIFNPGFSYQENWTDRKTIFNYNEKTGMMDSKVQKGFFRMYNTSYFVTLSTNIFGTVLFKSGHYLKGIRHVIRPQLSLSYTPDVNRKNYYNVVQEMNDGSRFVTRRGFFEDALFGNFGEGKSANLSFNISSSLEIKVRNKDDTTGKNPTKKISIIDNFNISGSYNLLKDTLQTRRLSNIQFSLATNILKKVQLNASASLDPYSYNKTSGMMVNKFAWQDRSLGFSLGRITNFSMTLSSAINYAPKDKNQGSNQEGKGKLSLVAQKFQDSLSSIYGRYQSLDTSEIKRIPTSNFSFSLNIGYNISYNERFITDMKNYQLNLVNQNLTLSGAMNLTENWNINFSTSLNIAKNFIFLALKEIQVPYFTFGVQRRLHCWTINLNIVPVGITQSFSIIVQPSSMILQNVKIQRNRSFFSQ